MKTMAEERNETDQGQAAEPAPVYDLKQPAAEDQIKPKDKVWKDEVASGGPASKAEDASFSPQVPHKDKAPIAPKAEDTSVKAKMLRMAAALAHNSKVAFELLRKRLERAVLNGCVLPRAYRALGKHVYGEGAYRADFPDAYVRLDGLHAEIALLRNQPPAEQEAATFMMKVQAAARAARHPLALPVLHGRMTNALHEIGKGAFEKGGEPGAAGEAARPIRDALARIEKLNTEMAELSQVQPGQIITPNRILVVGGIVILVLLLLLGNWLFFSGQPDQPPSP
jgi:hypothetical protein